MPSPRNGVYIGEKLWASPDEGCDKATEYLGSQSTCLDCPFIDCRDSGHGIKHKLSKNGTHSLAHWRSKLREKGYATR